MNITVEEQYIPKFERKYPCFVQHLGYVNGPGISIGNELWKNTVVLAFNQDTGIVLCTESEHIVVGDKVNFGSGAHFESKCWTDFFGIIEFDSRTK